MSSFERTIFSDAVLEIFKQEKNGWKSWEEYVCVIVFFFFFSSCPLLFTQT